MRKNYFPSCHYAVGSDETPQKRLAAVVSNDLIHLRRENLPNDESWERVRKIMQATTCKPAKGDEGAIEATTSQMTAEKAAEWLREVMSLFSEVAEESGWLARAAETNTGRPSYRGRWPRASVTRLSSYGVGLRRGTAEYSCFTRKCPHSHG